MPQSNEKTLSEAKRKKARAEYTARLEEARCYLAHSRDTIRNRGNTHESSLRYVAQYYGLKLRRVQCLVFGASVKLLEQEMDEIAVRFRQHLADQAQYLRACSTALNETIRAVEAGERFTYTREPGSEPVASRKVAKHGPRQPQLVERLAS